LVWGQSYAEKNLSTQEKKKSESPRISKENED